MPTRLLTEGEKEGRQHVVEASCNGASGRNYLFKKVGRFFNHVKLAYLDREEGWDGKDSFGNDIRQMLSTFENSDETQFTTLSSVPIDELQLDSAITNCTTKTVTVSTTKSDNKTLLTTPVTDNPNLAGIDDKIEEACDDRKLDSNQHLFVSIAWIVIPVFRYFLLCPEVIWCDVTSHSNCRGFHLLTFSCRTSLDRQVVFLHIWIPDQTRFSFRWVFQHALPTLIPKWARDRVQFIMKDGDPQQRNEILLALKEVFNNAIEGSCGWHIVGQGWKRHVPGSSFFSDSSAPKWIAVSRKIRSWCYTWMKPGYVENEEEYQISKLMLLQFVSSAAVLEAAEGTTFVIARILAFLKKYVFVYEDLYLWYKRKTVLHFNVGQGSQHEVSVQCTCFG